MTLDDTGCGRVLVTGGSGFIGTNLVEHFLVREVDVVNIDIEPPRNSAHRHCWRKVDLLDKKVLREFIQAFRPTYVLHMGARTDLDGRAVSDYAVNTDGVRNLIEAMEGVSSIRRVVFASSRLVCRIGYQPVNESDYCPSTPYGESKVIGEKIVRDTGRNMPCPWVIVRPTSIWGPWFDIPYKTFFMTIAKGRYVHPGSGQIMKSFGFVGNAVYELVSLLKVDTDKVAGRTFYLADYPEINVAEMAETIRCAEGAPSIRSMPVPILRMIAWLGDLSKILGYPHPPLTSFRLANLLTPMVHDMKPLSQLVGRLPFSMHEGVSITVNWLRQRGDIN